LEYPTHGSQQKHQKIPGFLIQVPSIHNRSTQTKTGPTTKTPAMDIQNTQSQMRKGVLEFCILSIIRQGEVYPSDLVDRMKAANLHILEGTLYPLLTRLKNAGLLTYRWVESNSGPPRKYFIMTDLGLEFYGELERTWKELADAVQTLTQPAGEVELSTETQPQP
jgi:PadR family transcriptional regulator PadR